MPTLFMTYGLPASGKSYWAKEYQKANPNVKRVNKDDLRAMLDDGTWSKDNEDFILSVRNSVISYALVKGLDVICDDTNLDPKHERTLRALAEINNAGFIIMDFSRVPLEECLKRDQNRQNQAGEKVIRTMYLKYLAQKIEAPKPVDYNSDLPDCYIFDLDGTLAKMNGRGPFEWDKVGQDSPNASVVKVYKALRESVYQQELNELDADFLIVSGRNSVCRAATEKWLIDHKIFYEGLLMRSEVDMRDDRIVKQEIYEQKVKGKYNVLGVFDDRKKVVELWRSLGLTCFQVADGDF